MRFQKSLILVVALILGLFISGCSKRDRLSLQQANMALKAGNIKAAIGQVNGVLKKSPHNFMAKRLKKKIAGMLFKQAEESMQAKRYAEAVEKVDLLLNEVDPQHEKAKALRDQAKKHVLIADARAAMENNNPMAALAAAREALRLDPQFEEAKQLETEAGRLVDEKIANLMATAQELIQQEKFEELRDLAQDILIIDPQNREVAELLREAQAQILAKNREQNLMLARKFYEEGIYESALARAEEVLKVDPQSAEAKTIVEKAKAEMGKPKLRLTGLTKIKGMRIAHIEVGDEREKFAVQEGETFGDFKVSAIDLDLKTVVVTYVKTGTQQSLTTGSE